MIGEEQDAETRIRAAARRVFLEQGYDGARIRQIADEAGVNVAMVNYYFRSKEQLFREIYAETFREFMGRMVTLFNEETPLEVKIWKLVDRYTDFILANPQLPLFVLSEMQKNGATFIQEMGIKNVFDQSFFRRQLLDETAKGQIRPVDPLQIMVMMMSNIIFPVMARPIISHIGALDDAGFRQFVDARKTIIPAMLMAYLRAE